MVEPSVDPSEGGDDGTDAALRAPSACMSSEWSVATSTVAVLTEFVLFQRVRWPEFLSGQQLLVG